MRLTILLTFTFLVLSVSNLHSQNFDVPKNYELKVAADYTQYEKAMIEAAGWLKNTPANEQLEKRKEVSRFVVQWISGSPTVNVELNETIFDFEKKNAGMLPLFMASCAKFVLENNYSKDMLAKNKAALLDMIAYYKTGKGINRDKKMEKLIKSEEEGKLDEWIEKNIKVGH